MASDNLYVYVAFWNKYTNYNIHYHEPKLLLIICCQNLSVHSCQNLISSIHLGHLFHVS